MKLRLTTWERISLINILYEARGPLGYLRKAGAALDALEMSDEEKAEVGYREALTPEGRQMLWEDEEREWELEVADREAAHILRRAAASYEGWRVPDRDKVYALFGKLSLDKHPTEPDGDVP